MKPNFVAIAGGSGSGKTWLAERLVSTLGPRAARLSLDDFYRDRSHLTLPERRHINFDHPRAIDWDRFQLTVDRLGSGQAVWVPRYDFTCSSRSQDSLWFPPMPLILIDGLWTLQGPAPRGGYALKIFVDCPASVRLSRRLERDQGERRRAAALVERQFWNHVEPMHEQFVEPQRDLADQVVESPVADEDVLRLVRRVEALKGGEEGAA